MACRARFLNALGHIFYAVDVTHGGAAIFLHDKSHGYKQVKWPREAPVGKEGVRALRHNQRRRAEEIKLAASGATCSPSHSASA